MFNFMSKVCLIFVVSYMKDETLTPGGPTVL